MGKYQVTRSHHQPLYNALIEILIFGNDVGSNNDEEPQEHHIFPKKFCEHHISDWSQSRYSSNVMLNTMFLSSETNKHWDKMNPADQVKDIIETNGRDKALVSLTPQFFSPKLLKICQENKNTVKDYEAFIDNRFNVLAKHLKINWEIGVQNSTTSDEDFIEEIEED